MERDSRETESPIALLARREGAIVAMLTAARMMVDSKEKMRNNLLRLSNNNRREELHERLTHSSVTADVESLLTAFDEEFLGLYPDFAERCQAKFGKALSRAVRSAPLPTELRMLALMKLGMTDVKRIAATLNVAPGTVYNHRSHLQSALEGVESLDKIVAQI